MSDAVKLTGFAASTLRRYVQRGLLEAFETPGGRLRFRREALEALLTPVSAAKVDREGAEG